LTLAPLSGWLRRFLAEGLRRMTCKVWWREYYVQAYFSSIGLLHTMEIEIVAWYRCISNGNLKSRTVPLKDMESNACTGPNRLRLHVRKREMKTVRGGLL
jgi:hypothetical protein